MAAGARCESFPAYFWTEELYTFLRLRSMLPVTTGGGVVVRSSSDEAVSVKSDTDHPCCFTLADEIVIQMLEDVLKFLKLVFAKSFLG